MTTQPFDPHSGSATVDERLRYAKHLFMTYRNGIVSDALRKAGLPFGVIFGLQLPQLRQIATTLGSDIDLARRLLADRNVRESRILGFALFPPESLTEQEALAIADDLLSREEADLYPFLLLRHTPHLKAVGRHLADRAADSPLAAYAADVVSRRLESL
ncbi:MAG: hypothetical protein K2I48_03085 [Muribaculaceae bacterium]|nr:hypothetical protein [Muribaculaceae bacterium]